MERDRDHPPGGSPLRVFVIEDHEFFRLGLQRFVDREPALVWAGSADNVADALARISRSEVDVVLLDLHLRAGEDGLGLLPPLSRIPGAPPVIVMSVADEETHAPRALRAGARGYVHKERTAQDLRRAIAHVLGGEIYASAPVIAGLLEHQVAPPVPVPPPACPTVELSARERDVLGLLDRGLAPKEIARELGISVKTVYAHRDHIRGKLGRLRDGSGPRPPRPRA